MTHFDGAAKGVWRGQKDNIAKILQGVWYALRLGSECPKHSFIRTCREEEGLNYLCLASKKFFHHVSPTMRQMDAMLSAVRPPAEIKTSSRKLAL